MRAFRAGVVWVLLSISILSGKGAGSEWTKLTVADAASNDELGSSVAISGATAIVGARRDDTANLSTGSAFVFERNQMGDWTQVKKLVPMGAGGGSDFGFSAVLWKNTGLIGAPGEDARGSEAGAAYVFERDLGGNESWGQRTKLFASDSASLAEFGHSTVLGNEIALVGAPRARNEGVASGAAYLFERNMGGPEAWGEAKKLAGIGAGDGARFGAALGLDGNTICVGAPGDSDDAPEAGAVYIFERDEGGLNNWGLALKLTLAAPRAGAEFGAALVLRKDRLIVGAPESSGSGNGEAYVFDRNLGGNEKWGLVGSLLRESGSEDGRPMMTSATDADALAPPPRFAAYSPVSSASPLQSTPGAQFGASLAMEEGLVVVGAPGESRSGSMAGAAYIFYRDLGGADQYGQAARLFGSDSSAEFRLGSSVALTGRIALVGAIGDDQAGNNSGSVYVFDPVVGAPTMRLRLLSAQEVSVEWTPNVQGYALDQASTLLMPWLAVSEAISPPVLFPRGNGAFYRLRPHARVELNFLPVGDPLNNPDTTGFGQVTRAFQISEFEVTNLEYTRFLNAVASSSDTAGLYNPAMATDPRAGIERTGTPGNYQFTIKTNMSDKPVVYVSYFDALRFINWLHNGQPFGALGSTEDGAYTFTAATSVSGRSSGAKVWLPSEDEWYKAAYYDPELGSGGYWLYPTRAGLTPEVGIASPSGDLSNPGPNIANFNNGAEWNDQVGNVTSVGGAGPQSRSAYGAADLGGNVAEWTEGPESGSKVLRGGSWADFEANLEATTRSVQLPLTENNLIGFRVARR